MRRKPVLVLLGLVLFASGSVGVAMARAGQTGTQIRVEGQEDMEVNALIFSTFRFTPDFVEVPSGGSITFVDKAETLAPHTLSIVKQSQLPQDFFEAIVACEVCGPLLESHFGSGLAFVDRDGDGGLSLPGESLLIEPFSPDFPDRITAKVTAPAGTTLRYLCAFHAWMQGTIKVTS